MHNNCATSVQVVSNNCRRLTLPFSRPRPKPKPNKPSSFSNGNNFLLLLVVKQTNTHT